MTPYGLYRAGIFGLHKMAVLPYSPYSPNEAPSDLFLFPKMKIKLKGRRLDAIEATRSQRQTVLNTPTKKHFQNIFQK
jgi:hypothetical protein